MKGKSQDFALPAASLAALRRALAAELGGDGAARALQQAGHAAGDAIFERIEARTGPPEETPHTAFWRGLAAICRSLGWGDLRHEEVHPGVGALEADDWFEARTAPDASRPSCFFTTGVLANVLGQAAGEDVAVLHVECRAAGGSRCRFLFGGRQTMEAVYGDLMAGRDADAAIAALG